MSKASNASLEIQFIHQKIYFIILENCRKLEKWGLMAEENNQHYNISSLRQALCKNQCCGSGSGGPGTFGPDPDKKNGFRFCSVHCTVLSNLKD